MMREKTGYGPDERTQYIDSMDHDRKIVEYGERIGTLERTDETILAKLEKLDEKIEKIYWFMAGALASSLASLGVILFNFGTR